MKTKEKIIKEFDEFIKQHPDIFGMIGETPLKNIRVFWLWKIDEQKQKIVEEIENLIKVAERGGYVSVSLHLLREFKQKLNK